MTEKRLIVLARFTSALILTATLVTLGLTWWLSDAVLIRSEVKTISRDAAEMLAIVGTAIRYYLIPAISLVAVLAVGNLVFCWKSHNEFSFSRDS